MRSQWQRLARAKAAREPSRHDDPSANFYGILGLRADVDAEKIKAAYRTLAKRFHPDANDGDTAAEQRTKEINRAYQTLGDPEARAAYDGELARQRAAARGRFWRGVAAGVATFVLIATSVSMMAPLIPHSSVPRPALGDRAASDKTEGLAAKLPEHRSAHADARESKSSASGDIAYEPPTMASSGPSSKTPTAPERAPEQPNPEHGAIEAGGPLDGKTRARTVSPAQPTPREDVASAPRSALPEGQMEPLPGENTPPRTGIANLVPPRIADPQQPPPAAAMPQAAPRGKPAIWKLYQNAGSGFSLRYPADVFAPAGDDTENKDRLLMSRDGRAVLRISSISNRGTMTIADYRSSLIAGRYADAKFDYAPQRSNWFVLSGTLGAEMFYERITFSCDGRSIHGWLMVYPRAERVFYDAIVEEIHRSYRHDPAGNGRCGELKSEGSRAPKRGGKPEAAAIDAMQY